MNDRSDHTCPDTQGSAVGPVPTSTSSHARRDPQCTTAPGGTTAGHPETNIHPTPVATVSLADPLFAFTADVLDDLEDVKIASQNRLRQLTRTGVDKDGEERGFGLDATHPDVARLTALVAGLVDLEHQAALNLQRKMRAHPLGEFARTHRGIGDQRLARLLAAIGDPYLNSATGQPRTVSQLWAYCGLHTLPADHRLDDTHGSTVDGGQESGSDLDHAKSDTPARAEQVAARRTKGQKSNWSTKAKTRAWLNIESCMKQLDAGCKTDTGVADHLDGCPCSAYRITVDHRRIHTAVTHPDWTPGHSLNDAMRIASKALLRDLWRTARDIHQQGQP